jgi:hypothetical protein
MTASSTELVALRKEVSDDPRFAVCYARGSHFKREGNFHRVEKGQRALVSRALCVVEHFKARCLECPNHDFTVSFRSP